MVRSAGLRHGPSLIPHPEPDSCGAARAEAGPGAGPGDGDGALPRVPRPPQAQGRLEPQGHRLLESQRSPEPQRPQTHGPRRRGTEDRAGGGPRPLRPLLRQVLGRGGQGRARVLPGARLLQGHGERVQRVLLKQQEPLGRFRRGQVRVERGVHLERQGLRADESARAEVPESPSAESQAASRQGRLPGNQSSHTQVEGRDLLIKAVL